MLFKMAFRNLLRNKRRTLLTSLMMIGGYTFISMSLALVNGSYGQIISAFTEQYTGHVQVANNDFVENPSLQKTIAHYNDRINEILITHMPQLASTACKASVVFLLRPLPALA